MVAPAGLSGEDEDDRPPPEEEEGTSWPETTSPEKECEAEDELGGGDERS